MVFECQNASNCKQLFCFAFGFLQNIYIIKTGVFGRPCRENSIILCSAVSTQYLHVRERPTNGHHTIAYTMLIAEHQVRSKMHHWHIDDLTQQ